VPIRESLMKGLLETYSPEEAKRVYYAMEAEGSGPFGPKGKYHADHVAWAEKHGVAPIETTKKARPRGRRASPKRR
jgi:hypothetical protein